MSRARSYATCGVPLINRSNGSSVKIPQVLIDRIELASLTRRILRSTRRALHKLGVTPPPMRIKYSKSSQIPFDMVIRRMLGHLELDFTSPYPLIDCDMLRARAYSAVYFMTHCPPEIRELSIHLGDGDMQSSMHFAFSANRADITLVPDIYFLGTKGFSSLRKVADEDTHSWLSRNQTLRWRGTDTGAGRKIFGKPAIWDETVNARIRMCMIATTLPDTDCYFASTEKTENLPIFERFGLLSRPIPESDWINDRYAIDVDGHTNTWSNMIARMHLGCCVLKVESQFGYRQWYYDQLKPGIHFVPVKPDMSDLAEKLAWARDNPKEAETIAKAGQALVRSMTLESETKRAVEIITQAIGAN